MLCSAPVSEEASADRHAALVHLAKNRSINQIVNFTYMRDNKILLQIYFDSITTDFGF